MQIKWNSKIVPTGFFPTLGEIFDIYSGKPNIWIILYCAKKFNNISPAIIYFRVLGFENCPSNQFIPIYFVMLKCKRQIESFGIETRQTNCLRQFVTIRQGNHL